MSLIILFAVSIGFYLSGPKEEDWIDRIRNYGVILLVTGMSLWVWITVFSGEILIPRRFETRYALVEEAKFIVKFIGIMGLVQIVIGATFRWYWPRKH